MKNLEKGWSLNWNISVRLCKKGSVNLGLWIPLVFLWSCASTRKPELRPRPSKILDCKQVVEKVNTRDRIMSALRGEALVDGQQFNAIDLSLAVKKDNFLRTEIKGPLGIVLGVMQMNDEWLMLYIPRQRTVYRLPTQEAFKDTPRRERFFSLLPIPLYPEVMFDVLLTRAALGSMKAQNCGYVEEHNVYAMTLLAKQQRKVVWIDPTTFAPIKIMIYDNRGQGAASAQSPRYHVNLSRLAGAGLASLPSEIKVQSSRGAGFEFIWKKASLLQGSTAVLFNWWPQKAKIKDY